jgi:hypothetical protein
MYDLVLSRRLCTKKSSRAISRVKLLNGEKTNVSRTISVLVLRVLMWLESNQPPTRKLTTGGVLHKRQTSSLARFHHSCVRNAFLEMVKGALNYNGGCAYANGIFVAPEGLDFFRLGVVATGGRL